LSTGKQGEMPFHFHSYAKINDGDYGVEVAAEVDEKTHRATLHNVWLYGIPILGRLGEEQKRLLEETAELYWRERVGKEIK